MFGHDEYDCYFDGSYSHEMCGVSGCAFCVFYGEGELLYEHVEYLRASSSTSAEKSALYLLLDYIKDNIKIGSTIRVYGDALGPITALLQNRNNADLTRILFYGLSDKFKLSLSYVPGKMNKSADKLSKIKPPMIFKPCVFPNEKVIPLASITIPVEMRQKKPSRVKFAKRLKFYEHTNRLYTNIQIDVTNQLLDGYISYLILKQRGIIESYVDVRHKAHERL